MDSQIAFTERRPDAGFSVVEALVALAILGIAGATLLAALRATTTANHIVVPAAARTTVRARIAAELRGAEEGAAKLGYFDALATFRAALHQPTAASSKETSATGGAPSGASEPSGESGGGSGGGPGIPLGTTEVPGTYSWGTGIMVGDERVLGPVAIWSDPVVTDQVGPAVVTLRTDPRSATLVLTEDFVSGSGEIHLGASTADDAARIASLREGDILYVSGLVDGATPVTALAALTAAPVELPTETLTSGAETPVHHYFSCAVGAPDAAFAWGLHNTAEAAQGVTIRADASVALLDRLEPVVVYYTARHERASQVVGPRPTPGPIGLYRAIGDPTKPETRELLVDDVGQGLTATLTSSEPAETPSPAVEQVLSVGLPLVDPESGPVVDLVRIVYRMPARPSVLPVSLLKLGGAS